MPDPFTGEIKEELDDTNITLPLQRDLSPVPRDLSPIPRDVTPVPREDEDLRNEHQRYYAAGTPTVQFRASTPMQHERALVDVNTTPPMRYENFKRRKMLILTGMNYENKPTLYDGAMRSVKEILPQ
ncbi:Hypothetical predicted protein [Mytilus galloprovincialis]|uniref:Uncharacterized protein n=1 Tax=Mytilus galloprovincialis TaxID=29158 RepID=A0A8B6GKM8_MYTGA|nr:Hypothetical predicted protein [Mytilus galloprovincialis]